MNTINTSEVLKVNIGTIVKNWSIDFIREKHNCMKDYISTKVDEYSTMTHVNKDMNRSQIHSYILTAFLSPVTVLQSEIRKQQSFGNNTTEYKHAINYYNKY